MAKNNKTFFGVTNTFKNVQKEAKSECDCKKTCCVSHDKGKKSLGGWAGL